MIIRETALEGAFQVDLQRSPDERGFFARTFCEDGFKKAGLLSRFPQCNVSFNEKKGTLRGMHFQADPKPEAKLVRCTMGAIYDVIVDLRVGSPTFRKWVGVELTAENRTALYIPHGFAHGFLTLADQSEVFYQMGELYYAELARGVRWNDPAFGIQWPAKPTCIAPKDETFADFSEAVLK